MDNKNELKHIAFIMDGNGRWAKARHLPRHLGHKAGCERVTDVYEVCYEMGIKAISLYAFSTENWNRPKAEINHLFGYLEIFFKKEINRMLKDGCRIIASGDLTRLPAKTQKVVIYYNCIGSIEIPKEVMIPQADISLLRLALYELPAPVFSSPVEHCSID